MQIDHLVQRLDHEPEGNRARLPAHVLGGQRPDAVLQGFSLVQPLSQVDLFERDIDANADVAAEQTAHGRA